ncbi:hypothetical protein CANCADRAFT_11350, partial [Tortispora caseinolytica NRRL Y-17796]
KRYEPRQGDVVVGVIDLRLVETYKVNIGAPYMAILPALAFQNAHRKNKPELEAGDVVCARVVKADPDVEPELTCDEDDLGVLNEGYVFDVSLSHAHALINNDSLLAQLAKSVVFETGIGRNGTVWVKGDDTKSTLAVSRLIRE